MQSSSHEIQQLRDAGYDVRVRHRRRVVPVTTSKVYSRWEMPHFAALVIGAKGGRTDVIISREGQVVGQSSAHCSVKENFNRKIGLRVALGRAIKKAGIELPRGEEGG